MPSAESSVPTFVRPIVGESDDAKRLGILQQTHPEYAARKQSWQVLLDAFEASGGFLDGTYLWEYPREDSTDYRDRQVHARYHNYVESLIDLYVRFIFSMGVHRESKSPEFNDWIANVDGAGTSLDDLLRRAASVSLCHGHAGVLVDKTPDAPTGPTKQDEKARVIAAVFTALAIPEWRFAGPHLQSVKLLEAAPAVPITTPTPTGDDAVQYLLWDAEGWARFDATGQIVAADTPNLGLVPLAILRPKPSYTSQVLGRPLISNANVVRAIFDRASEEDNVIRTQAFSVLAVSVPPDGNVAQTKTDLGVEIGATKALVAKGTIQYITPDSNVPGAIRANIEYLVQELYRAAHIRFKRDSLDAESAEAIRLQHAELNEMLQGFAKALQAAEKQIARYYFAWQAPDAKTAEADFEAAKVEAIYPSEFFLGDLLADLEAWAEGIRMDLGESMTKRMKKTAVRRIDPDIPADDLKKIDAEIDAQKNEPPPTDMIDPEAVGIRGALNG